MVESILLGLIGMVICKFLHKMSCSLGKMESTLKHVSLMISDHETRLRTLEKPDD